MGGRNKDEGFGKELDCRAVSGVCIAGLTTDKQRADARWTYTGPTLGRRWTYTGATLYQLYRLYRSGLEGRYCTIVFFCRSE